MTISLPIGRLIGHQSDSAYQIRHPLLLVERAGFVVQDSCIEQLFDDPYALGVGPDITDPEVMRQARR